MEKNLIILYQENRDDLLKIVSEKLCISCTDPHKNNKKIDYINPLNCECRCERVDNIIEKASDLDNDIKKIINKH
ncbi:MAG: hypothetical protein KAI84_15435 [Gammaproteobacteria bacterium]|nr:hypothetical protein [Gammaproteobacteria bacterium]